MIRKFRFLSFAIVAILVLTCTSTAEARTLAEIEAEASALEAEAEYASMTRRIEIVQRLQELMQEAMTAGAEQIGMTNIPEIKPAATPEEEAKRRRMIINEQLKLFKRQMPRKPGNYVIEVAEAFPMTGLVVINGGEKTNPYRGWVWKDLWYHATEEFVGNLIVSTEIKSSVAGQECVEASAAIPGHCTNWQTISRSDIEQQNRYPSLYDWVVMGSSEGSKMEVETSSPTIVFSSPSRRATASVGCFRAKWEMKKKDFEALLDRDVIKLTKQVGRTSQATPGCRMGSNITLYLWVKTPECHIQYTTDPTLIYGCGDMAPQVGLKAYLTKGTAQGYKWSIVNGSDKIEFMNGGSNPTTREVDIKAKAASGTKGDVGLEVEIKRTDGTRCVATIQKTAKRPSALRRLPDSEAQSFDIKPFYDFAAECASSSGCIKSPIAIPGNPDIGAGYIRISANQVVDQFYEPILRDPMRWLEKRWMMVNQGGTQTRIDIQTPEESAGGTQIPVVPGQSSPTLSMYSNHGLTEGGGILIDNLGVMYPVGSSVPNGLDFKINQNIKIFECPVAKCVQHFKKTDATHTCLAP